MRPFAASILRKRLLLASMIATAGLGSSGTLRAQLLLDPPPEALPTPSSVIGGSSQTEATLSSGEQSLEVPPEEVDGVTPLLRGPLHEAYAERFDMDQEEPIIVGKEPPAWVDEQPPEYRPEGEDYVWIPGYWGWDIIEEDFIWVSGIWRQVPPDTQWVPGYWTEVEGGWQWVSGFWTTTEQEEIVYLPPPPENIDHGPSSPAPGDDYFWIPGYWQYRSGNYAWQSGYWSVGQNDWVWVPTRYVWTPSGYICRRGYWDYRLPNRGVLFTPVRLRANYVGLYRPRYIVDINPLWLANLFVARGIPQYYYGNHFGYRGSRQVYPWVTYYQHGYDPLLSYYAYQGRHSTWLRQLSQLEREIATTPRLQSQATVSAQLRAQQQFRREPSTVDTLLRVASASALAAGNRNDFKAPISLRADKSTSLGPQASLSSPIRDLSSKRKELEKAITDVDKNRSMRRSGSAADAEIRTNADGKIELKQLTLQRPERGNGSKRESLAIPKDLKIGSKVEARVDTNPLSSNRPTPDANAQRTPRGNNGDRRPSNSQREQRIKQLEPVLGESSGAKPLNSDQLKSIRDQLLGNNQNNSRSISPRDSSSPARGTPPARLDRPSLPQRTPRSIPNVQPPASGTQLPSLGIPDRSERSGRTIRPDEVLGGALRGNSNRGGGSSVPNIPKLNPGSGAKDSIVPRIEIPRNGGNRPDLGALGGGGGNRGKAERSKGERSSGRGGDKGKKD